MLPTDVIGDAYANSRVGEALERVVRVRNRMAGTEGEMRGARVMEHVFEELGLRDVAVEEFDIPGWW